MRHTIAIISVVFAVALTAPLFAGDGARPGVVVPMDGGIGSTYGPIAYDPSGNIISIGTNTTSSNEYTYDPEGRIALAIVLRGGLQQQSYTYDAYGNLLVTATSGARLVRSVDGATNRLKNETPLFTVYDQAGNMTGWTPPGQTTRGYSYDALNMMTREAAETSSGSTNVYHVYTASDERHFTETVPPSSGSKGSPMVTAVYTLRDLQGKVLREYRRGSVCVDTCTLTVDRDYGYRNGQLLGVSTPSGSQYYSLDHLGTPRIVTDQSGYFVAEHVYFPFGVEITDNSPTDGPLRFTGHERDADVLSQPAGALDYMHARYYSATMGRFSSVDPTWASADLGNPQSWNRYSYVLNNPINMTDPDGRDAKEYGLAIWATAAEFFVDYVLEDGDGLDPEPAPDLTRSAFSGTVVTAYQVGTVDRLRAGSVPGDKIDIHHAPQAKPAGQAIAKYDPAKAPGIALPAHEHKAIPTQKGAYSGTARDLVAKDVRDLRNHTKAPNSALRKLVKLIKEEFPAAMKKLAKKAPL